MKFGLIESKSTLRVLKGDFFAGLRANSAPTSSYTYVFPPALPAITQGLLVDSAGNLSYYTAGTVSSVNLSANAIFTVSGAPITSNGTINLGLANQNNGLVLAGPVTGTAAPTFRQLGLSELTAPTGNVSLGGYILTNVAAPVNPTDAVNKTYADGLKAGLSVREAVRYATISNIASITTTTQATIEAALDGTFTLTTGDRILVRAQTDATQNGIYTWNGTNLVRSADADTSAQFSSNIYFFVQQGATYADSGWVLTNDGPVTLGTTPISFAQYSQAGVIYDGAGLEKTGNTISIGTASSTRIVVNANNIDLAQTAVTPGTYSGITVDQYGRITGATNSSTTSYRASFTNANLTTGVLTVVHNLGEKIVNVQISDDTDKVILPDEITLTNTTQLSVDLTSFGAITGTYNIIVKK